MIRYALEVLFRPPTIDADALRERFPTRVSVFAEVPGLHAKVFLLDEDRGEFGGLYVFDSEEARAAYPRSDLFAATVSEFGAPELREFEVNAMLERDASGGYATA